MAAPELWVSVLAGIKAVFESTKAGIDLYADLSQKYKSDPEVLAEAQRVSTLYYSTYSDRELDAILKRVEACRDRFISEGSGTNRNVCLCSVFQDVASGNGGTLPDIDDWRNIASQLGCTV